MKGSNQYPIFMTYQPQTQQKITTLRYRVDLTRKTKIMGQIIMKTKKLPKSNTKNLQGEVFIHFGAGKRNKDSGSTSLSFIKLQRWDTPFSKCTTKHTRDSNLAKEDQGFEVGVKDGGG